MMQETAACPAQPPGHAESEEGLLSWADAAAYCGLNPHTFAFFVKAGKLKPDLRLGRRGIRYYRQETLDAFKEWHRCERPLPGNPNWSRKGNPYAPKA